MKSTIALFMLVCCCLVAVTQESKYSKNFAFINTKGEIVIDAKYKWVTDFENGRAKIKKYVVVGNKAYYNYGFIDVTGKEVIPAIYDKVNDFKKGVDVTWVRKRGDDKYILIDKNGNRVGTGAYHKVGSWFDGMCQVKVEDKTRPTYQQGKYLYNEGFVNTKGEVIIDPAEGYFGAPAYSDGLVCLTKENAGYGFLNTNGDVVVPLIYKQGGFSNFEDGLARMSKNGKTGLLNKAGDWVVEPFYKTVSGFGDSLLTVSFGSSFNNFGYCDFKNKVVIKGQYDRASSFEGGFAEVTKNQKQGIINTKGEIVIPLVHEIIYNDIQELGYFRALNDRTWTYYTKEGKEISEIEAKSRGNHHQNIFPVFNLDTKTGHYYSTNGQKAFDYTYCKTGEFTKEGLALVLLCDDMSYPRGKLLTEPATDIPEAKENIANPNPTTDVLMVYENRKYKTGFGVPGKVKVTDGSDSYDRPQLKVESLSTTSKVTVVVSTLKQRIKPDQMSAALEKAGNRAVQNMGTKELSSEPITISNEKAIKKILEKNGIRYLYVISIKETLLYQWIFLAAKEDFDGHLEFLQSIHLID